MWGSSKAKQKKTITENDAENNVGGVDETKGHCRCVLGLGWKKETAETHSSMSLPGLIVGDGSMWVSTKGGVLADGGDLVRPFLGGEPVPGLGPGVGHLEKSLLPIAGGLLSSDSKSIRGPVG